MSAHDWTLVDDGIFHAFHTLWMGQINYALNDGLLPAGYYALPEQHAGNTIADVLTLHASAPPPRPHPLPPATGGSVLAEAPPRTRHRLTLDPAAMKRRRSLAIRHVSGHRLVALIEIISPGNKDRVASVRDFAEKAASALESGVHLLTIDLFPPGPSDPHGMNGAIRRRLERLEDFTPEDPPEDGATEAEPMTLAAYAAGPRIEVFLEHLAVGADLPDMPLFLRPDRYVNVPLEQTYQAAYGGMPAFWRDVLEGRPPQSTDR